MSHDTKGFTLVTGASSGIGAISADRPAKRGYGGAQRRPPANAGRQDRRRSRPQGRGDRRRLEQRKDLAKVETVLRIDRRITTLVNNAGVGSTAPLLQANVDKMSDMIALNIDALTRLSTRPCRRMTRSKHGSMRPSHL
jgi:uncharacterized protein